MIALTKAALAGDFASARALHYKLAPVMRALFTETNPICIKAAMAMLGYCEGELRLPLTTITEPNREVLRAALAGVGLLK
jgi:4-hydroxy-tetrahydrodipicolinate synthase